VTKSSPPKTVVGLAAAAIYIAIMGVGMWYMYHVKGVTYGSVAMFDIFWPFLVVCTLANFAFVIRFFGWRGAGFSEMRWKELLWFTPFIALLAYKFSVNIGALAATPPDAAQVRQLVFMGAVIFLVGLGEELAFRGLLLRSFFNPRNPLPALFISAVGFSLLHSVNIFGGEPGPSVLYQLFYTFLWGVMFAPLAIRMNNIWPLIIGHWLYDYVQFITVITQKAEAVQFDLWLYPVEIVIGVILSFQLWRDRERG
jgi:membrane protease YdiL (CAAX protease family)